MLCQGYHNRNMIWTITVIQNVLAQEMCKTGWKYSEVYWRYDTFCLGRATQVVIPLLIQVKCVHFVNWYLSHVTIKISAEYTSTFENVIPVLWYSAVYIMKLMYYPFQLFLLRIIQLLCWMWIFLKIWWFVISQRTDQLALSKLYWNLLVSLI